MACESGLLITAEGFHQRSWMLLPLTLQYVLLLV